MRTIVNGVEIGNGGGGGSAGGACIAAAPLTFGNANISATTTTRYLAPTGDYSSATAVTDPLGYTAQAAGTVKRLQILIGSGNGNGNDVTYTVTINGAPTGLTLDIASTDAGLFEIVLDAPVVDGDEIAIEITKALAIGTSPTEIQAFVQLETDCGGGGGAAAGFAPLENMFYVATNGDDGAGTGSIAEPFLTIQRAYDEIGDASTNTEWNDPDARYWVVKVSPGIYSDDALLPIRPSVWTHLDGASIDGTVQLNFPAALITSGIESPQWGFSGNGRRSVWDGSGAHTINGITGDFQIIYGAQVPSFFPQIHLQRTGVVGDFQVIGEFSGAQLMMTDAVIGGAIENGAPAFALSVWASGVNNETAGDIEGIGGALGNVNLFHLDNVLLKNCDVSPTVNGWRWNDVRLEEGGAFDFSLSDVEVQMDESTYEEYVQAVDIASGLGFPQVRVDIDDGDPWKQVRSSTAEAIATGAASLLAGMAITNLLPGAFDFAFTANASVGGGDPSAGRFWLYKNGVPVADTERTLVHFDTNSGTVDNAGSVAIVSIESSVPTDLWEIWVQNTGFPGRDFDINQRIFRAIRVGPQIPEVAPP